jgi:LacI family transcriptional regulator
MPGRHVTMKDIAERANVSQPAVSYAINNKKGLDPKTRERILTIAREMGYRPNILMKGLKMGRTMSIGVMVRCDNDFFGQICVGAQQRMAEDGYVSILGFTGPEDELAEIYNLIDRRVDGIILSPMDPDALVNAEGMDKIREREIPMVTVNTVVEQTREIDFVGTDDFHGGQMAAQHFLDQGHVRTAFWYPVGLGNRPHGAPVFQRLDGFKTAVEEAGGDVIVDESQDASRLLNREPRPSAVFICNDLKVPAFYKLVEQAGLKIPDDISVIGFGNRSVAELISPPLTTLEQDPMEIGRHAAELLLDRICGDQQSEEPIRIRLEPTMVVRESTLDRKARDE